MTNVCRWMFTHTARCQVKTYYFCIYVSENVHVYVTKR